MDDSLLLDLSFLRQVTVLDAQRPNVKASLAPKIYLTHIFQSSKKDELGFIIKCLVR